MPNDSITEFTVGQATHAGLVRDKNEDSFGWFSLEAGELFVVADGMGGYAGGAEASKLTVRSFKEYFEAHPGDPEQTLLEALLYADSKVLEIGRENPVLKNCGSTIVVLFVSGNKGYFIHAGDSRLYRFHDGRLMQVSRDHSAVQDMIKAGVISGREAEKVPKNVITQSVGGNIDAARCTAEQFEIEPGSSFLLCSDGLWGTVPEDRIHKILSQPVPSSSKANLLINAAVDAGGPDNITVQVIEFGAPEEPEQPKGPEMQEGQVLHGQQMQEDEGRGRLFWITVSVLLLAAVIICAYFGYKWLAEPSPAPEAPAVQEMQKPEAEPADAGSQKVQETEPSQAEQPEAAPETKQPEQPAAESEAPKAQPPAEPAPVPEKENGSEAAEAATQS